MNEQMNEPWKIAISVLSGPLYKFCSSPATEWPMLLRAHACIFPGGLPLGTWNFSPMGSLQSPEASRKQWLTVCEGTHPALTWNKFSVVPFTLQSSLLVQTEARLTWSLVFAFSHLLSCFLGLPWYSAVKNPPAMQESQEIWVPSWVGKIPWRWIWKTTLVFLPGESLGQRNLEGWTESIGSQRVSHNWSNLSCFFHSLSPSVNNFPELPWRSSR